MKDLKQMLQNECYGKDLEQRKHWYSLDLVFGHMVVEVTYLVDQYLLLLNTYSPHLKLEPQQKQPLFSGLCQVLEQNGDRIELSYVSAFHIARPN